MTTNQEGKQAAFRAIGGTSGTYNEDAIAAMIAEGASGTTFNEIMISWLQIRTGSSDDNINNLKQAFADAEGFDSWDAVNTFGANFGGPADIADLLFWYDFTDSNNVTLSGSKITQVTDNSTNSFTITQGTDANRPDYDTAQALFNDLNVGEFDHLAHEWLDTGTDTKLDNIFAGGAYIAVLCRTQSDGGSNEGRILNNIFNTGNNGWRWFTQTDNGVDKYNLGFVKRFSGAFARWDSTGDDAALNEVQVLTLEYDSDSASNDPVMTVNGTAISLTETIAPSGTASTETNCVMGVGGHGVGYDGKIAHVIGYGTIPSATEKTNLINYLKNIGGI